MELCNRKHKQEKKSQLQRRHSRSSWRPGRKPEVDWDETQVSVGGLLEQEILGKFWESHRRKMHDKSTKEQCTRKIVSVYLRANT
jgi:hypothetical protein